MKEGERLKVEVRDSGGGIEKEDKERMLEELWKKKKGGLGIGIKIRRKIVERSGGKIEMG